MKTRLSKGKMKSRIWTTGLIEQGEYKDKAMAYLPSKVELVSGNKLVEVLFKYWLGIFQGHVERKHV